jgi:hypothetical protein
VVDDRLQHGGDDGRAARAADGEGRLAVLQAMVGAMLLRGRLPASGMFGAGR